MDKAIIGVLLIAILAIVSATSLAYYIAIQSSQTQNNHSPTPTPSSEPTQSPVATPTPPNEASVDLMVNCTLDLRWTDSGTPRLFVLGSITNVGTKTAYSVAIHVKTWFSNGTQAIIVDHQLSVYDGHILPNYPVDIKPNETYSSGTLVGMLGFPIPDEIWADWEVGYVEEDCISTYIVTAS